MKNQFLFHVCLSIILLINQNFNAFGQASLATENVIDDIKVTTKYGAKKQYTVFRDAAFVINGTISLMR